MFLKDTELLVDHVGCLFICQRWRATSGSVNSTWSPFCLISARWETTRWNSNHWKSHDYLSLFGFKALKNVFLWQWQMTDGRVRYGNKKDNIDSQYFWKWTNANPLNFFQAGSLWKCPLNKHTNMHRPL